MYLESLEQSAFTLCPCGNNPETHRLWEALHSGSIPVLERCGGQGSSGWYEFLHKHIPHLIIIDSWHDLSAVLGRYDANQTTLDQLQVLVYVEFQRYLKFVSRAVAKAAVQAWNISM